MFQVRLSYDAAQQHCHKFGMQLLSNRDDGYPNEARAYNEILDMLKAIVV